jgi:hypothetical protein
MDSLTQLLDAFTAQADTPAAVSPIEVLTAIGLSLVLTLVIAAVYQHTYRGAYYSQDYVHTLLLLGMLVAVVIMGIGGNIARAFGIFAAFSIIRFRSALPDARDLGFIFFAMTVGLAAGAREYGLAVLTTAIVGVAVLLVSRLDLFAPQRPSHILRVRVTNDIDYDHAFAEPFARLAERISLLSVESIQAGLMSELRYAVRLREGASPRELVAEIQRRNGNNRVLLTAAQRRFGDDD